MPYLARRRMTLGNQVFAPGDIVPQGVINVIPPGRFGSMVRLRHIEEVTQSQAVSAVRESDRPSPAPEVVDGEMCPICDEGPFKNVAGHMTKMHKQEE